MQKLLGAGVMAAVLAAAGSAHAALVFVGSWDVYNAAAPQWDDYGLNGPLAYTGQEAAALLFGGSAANYVISTAGDQVGDINHLAWYDRIGAGGAQLAEDYDNKYLGFYYGPTDSYCCGSNHPSDPAASAFVRDNLSGENAINYAFIDDGQGAGGVPEPASWALMILGFGLAGTAMRRRASLTA